VVIFEPGKKEVEDTEREERDVAAH
jgi:hypothetical protein